MTAFKFIFCAQLLSTLFMTGLIWFVQIVHYPLYDQVSTESFTNYENIHCRLTTNVVALPMIVEALSSLLFLLVLPKQIYFLEALVGLILTLIIWLATALYSVPNHAILSSGFNEKAYHELCRLNWIRTICWSLRSLLLLRFVIKLLP